MFRDKFTVTDSSTGISHDFPRATIARAYAHIMSGSDRPFQEYLKEGEMPDLLRAIKGTKSEGYKKWFRLDGTTVVPFDLEWILGMSLFEGQTEVDYPSALFVPLKKGSI